MVIFFYFSFFITSFCAFSIGFPFCVRVGDYLTGSRSRADLIRTSRVMIVRRTFSRVQVMQDFGHSYVNTVKNYN